VTPRICEGSQNQSVISGGDHQSQFKARPFLDKNTFIVKKSVKNLTVPETFRLNTNERAENKSNSKSR